VIVPILVLRPEPGASETAARARPLGLQPLVSPLFTIHPVPWEAPHAGSFDAVLLTSANAARHAGAALRAFTGLACYTVGEATAAAARAAGFVDVRIGPSDGAEAVSALEREGLRHVLHLCGRDYMPLRGSTAAIERRVVYASEPLDALPVPAEHCLAAGAIALIHSPRAGIVFASLVDRARLDRGRIALAAISSAAADAAGAGWLSVVAAERPRDEALLELVAKLCQNGWPQE
jgi:uroporphyrinogen-III synthase